MQNPGSDGWNCVAGLAVLMRLSSFPAVHSVGACLLRYIWGFGRREVAGRRERDSFELANTGGRHGPESTLGESSLHIIILQ